MDYRTQNAMILAIGTPPQRDHTLLDKLDRHLTKEKSEYVTILLILRTLHYLLT